MAFFAHHNAPMSNQGFQERPPDQLNGAVTLLCTLSYGLHSKKNLEAEGTAPTAGVPENICRLCHNCVRSWQRGNNQFPALING